MKYFCYNSNLENNNFLYFAGKEVCRCSKEDYYEDCQVKYFYLETCII